MWLYFGLIALVMQGYVAWHVWQLLPWCVGAKVAVMALIAVAVACAAGQFYSDKFPLWLATTIYEVGNSWLVISLYLTMAFLLLDIGRLTRLVPASWTHGNGVTCGVLTLLMLVIFIGGNIHYHHKQRREITITSPKVTKPHKIVMFSDMHCGYHNRRAEIARWVDTINAERPDVVLIAGDIIDGYIRPVDKQATWKEFRRISAPVYACLGNHEYITGLDASLRFYRQAGIKLLRDRTARVGNLLLIGRDDRSNRQRAKLAALLPANNAAYSIVLDHQPYQLEQAETAGIDLQLSGHTHHGQVFPLNLLTNAMYECAYGWHSRGNTRYYVSSGIGLWGGKFRIGTDSEYLVINITPARRTR